MSSATRQGSCTGPAADAACGALNFFTSRRTACTWARQNLDYTGEVVDQSNAEVLRPSVFGSLLATAEPREGRRG
ncbi:organomercurial lyase [Streptomyces galilaeus]|uniref:organomercurial lyase n=1 Tax=Streptomyces galilaeus TaxID=33899 RepID=UPI003570FDB0